MNDFKKTIDRLKKMLKDPAIKRLASIVVVIYIYLLGMFAQVIHNPSKGFSSNPWAGGVPTKKVIKYNPISALLAIFTTSNKGLLFFIAILFIFIIFALIHLRMNREDTWDERGFNISTDGTYGTAGWMTREEMDKVLEVNTPEDTEGTILGKLDENPEEGWATEAYQVVSLPTTSGLNKHTAVYGASGTGKSRSFVRPQIMQCAKRGESLVITDPKGEMYEDTAEYLRDKGYKVRIYNLVDPQYSDSWNCLSEITHDPNKVELMAQTFADVIITNTAGPSSDHFWDSSEMNLLKALALYVALDEYKTPEERNVGTMYEMLTNNSEQQLNAMFDKLSPDHPAKQPWGIFSQAGEGVRGNIIIGLGSRLQVFQSEVIRAITSTPDIDLEEPGKRKTAIFVIMSDQDETLSFISSLFFAFLFIRLVRYADSQPDRRVKVPVNFILDEFPNIGQIPDFTKKLSTIRSRELRVAVIFQNISQLQNRYPNGLWEEIIGNCDTQLFLGCSDGTTANFISERTGEITIDVTSSRVNRQTMQLAQRVPEYSESESAGKRYLLTADEVLRLPNENALIIIRGQKVLKVNKFDYSLHPDANLFKPCKVIDYQPSWRKGEDFKPKYSIDHIIEDNKLINNANNNINTLNDTEELNDDTTNEIKKKKEILNELLSKTRNDKKEDNNTSVKKEDIKVDNDEVEAIITDDIPDF